MMKRTLAILAALLSLQSVAHAGPVQNWDRIVTGSRRFTVLTQFGSAAARDNETGLVWVLDTAFTASTVFWREANTSCLTLILGNRRGWRLPTVEELSSLLDPSQLNPQLPLGHPFTVGSVQTFWSSTTVYGITGNAYVVALSGTVGLDPKTDTIPHGVWCVRGGHSTEGQ